MPQRRPIVPPVRKTLKLSQEILVATTNAKFPVTAEVGTDLWEGLGQTTGSRTPSARALESGNNTKLHVTGTVDVNTATRSTDTPNRNATNAMLTSSCLIERRSGSG